jgi:catechol 2,3-dioxygenase-like lactoylglutathione lyase family enzyme
MSEELDQLLNRYENGHITRRELLGALSALVVAAAPAATAAEPAIGAVKQLNHVTLFVPNVQKSVEFYQSLFGMPVLTPQDPGINLSAGTGFLGIYPSPAGASASIDHICLALENFDADAVLKMLTDRGLKGSIRLRGDTTELYFTDPDNIRVQLQDVSYRGGVGRRCDPKRLRPAFGAHRLTEGAQVEKNAVRSAESRRLAFMENAMRRESLEGRSTNHRSSKRPEPAGETQIAFSAAR